METTHITENIHAMLHPQIIKKINIQTIILSFILSIAGIISIYACYRQEDTKSSAAMLLLIAGILLIGTGIILLFAKYGKKVYKETNSPIKNNEYYFAREKTELLKKALTKNDFSDLKPVSFSENGSNSRLNIILSEDNNFAAVQLFEFVPYAYHPVSQVCYFEGNSVKPLIDYLHKCQQNK